MINSLSWRLPISEGSTLLLIMKTSQRYAPLNLALVGRDTSGRRVHGDVLMLIERNGKPVTPTQDDILVCKGVFKR
jgi:hypothetical protein